MLNAMEAHGSSSTSADRPGAAQSATPDPITAVAFFTRIRPSQQPTPPTVDGIAFAPDSIWQRLDCLKLPGLWELEQGREVVRTLQLISHILILVGALALGAALVSHWLAHEPISGLGLLGSATLLAGLLANKVSMEVSPGDSAAGSGTASIAALMPI